MPISLDKSVGPVQVIEFLGLTIDLVLMVVRVPQDKLQDISSILITMIKKCKATGYKLESLTGKINFISRREELHSKDLPGVNRDQEEMAH